MMAVQFNVDNSATVGNVNYLIGNNTGYVSSYDTKTIPNIQKTSWKFIGCLNIDKRRLPDIKICSFADSVYTSVLSLNHEYANLDSSIYSVMKPRNTIRNNLNSKMSRTRSPSIPFTISPVKQGFVVKPRKSVSLPKSPNLCSSSQELYKVAPLEKAVAMNSSLTSHDQSAKMSALNLQVTYSKSGTEVLSEASTCEKKNHSYWNVPSEPAATKLSPSKIPQFPIHKPLERSYPVYSKVSV